MHGAGTGDGGMGNGAENRELLKGISVFSKVMYIPFIESALPFCTSSFRFIFYSPYFFYLQIFVILILLPVDRVDLPIRYTCLTFLNEFSDD